ncbi:hypothetical protein BJ322DRAFT_996824 [Thelephora terrestris]|uniref:T6SS Phospholipase effector Tle1-like catalytic domain-containing protein n=1 Tax=Thelephora terrestris TaxID=56493 RepID=A0A9P6LDB4_9AGAM|nr:hypothetical protein BJ322DRAFT_996824 [Thelephora terrestris]
MSLDSSVRQPRVIVLCFDGTSNQYGSTNTNVVKFYGLLNKSRPFDQIVYYQPGIGTFFNPGVVSPLLEWLARTADLAMAWYLNEHVRAGYRFLTQNYRQGDKICLFGFSRGAYTARALAGFLFKIGLLPKDNEEQIPFAYRLYKREDKVGRDLAAGYKRTFCTPVTIDFVGVWDTVASVGLLYGRSLPFTTDNDGIRMFRHALSLDEHRAKFQPNMFQQPYTEELNVKRSRPKLKTWKMTVRRLSEMERYRALAKENSTSSKPRAFTRERSPLRKTEGGLLQSVEEVWFAGCHADVGGGTVADDCRYSLADISLRWMVKQVILSQCGILFDLAALRRADIDISNIITTDFQQPTDQDALTDPHDQLKMKKAWWILEIMPMKYAWQDAKGKWHAKWGFNLGKGREIREEEPRFHRSVRERMLVKELDYRPRARWNVGREHYVG